MAFKFSAHQPVIDSRGCMTPEFLRAFNSLLARVGGGSRVGPSAPTGLTYSIEAGGVRLQCNANPAAEEVTAYIWRVGATWADSLLLVNFSSNNELIPSDQVGTYTVWVAAADVRGNFSTPSSLEVTVTDADLGLYGPKVTLTSTGLAFSNGDPASIAVTALLLNLPSPTYVWTVDGVLDGTATTGTYTLNAFTGAGKLLRCTVTSGVSGLSAYGETTIYSVADGSRGSLKGYGSQYSISVSAWSDAKANRVINNMLTGATGTTDLLTTTHLRIGDTVQLTNGSSYVESRFWSGSAWIAAATVIEGNVLVNGQGVFTGDITGGASINITGSATFNGSQTVDGSGYAAVINSGGTYAAYGLRVYGSASGMAIHASNGAGGGAVYGTATSGTGYGVYGYTTSATGAGVIAGATGGGTALKVEGPMTINNTTAVTNLNADLLDGNHASAFATSGHNHSGVYLPVAGTAADSSALGGYAASSWTRIVNGNTGTANAGGSGFTMQMGTGLAPTYEVACSSNNIILQTASCRTLKQDIEDETHGLAFVKALRPRKFRFISDPEFQQHGFIAQEMAEVATPNGEKDALAFTREDGIMGINHLSLVGILVKAVQEQAAEVAALRAEVAALR